MTSAKDEANFLHPEHDLQGWYIVATSGILRDTEVRSIDMLHRKIVIYRGKDGLVRAFDAHCPHLGANLGHGSVIENDLQCAFHGWRFGIGGLCTHAPNLDPPPQRKLRQYPVQEKWGLIWLFNGAHPLFKLPEPEPTLFPFIMPSVYMSCHPHLMIANGLDSAHFEPLHHIRHISPPEIVSNTPFTVTAHLCGEAISPLHRRLVGGSIQASFSTIGGNMAWVTVTAPIRCHFMFTGQPEGKGCRSRVIAFLPRSLNAIRAMVIMYLLLHDDRKILSDIAFKSGFVATDFGLHCFVQTINAMRTA
jgi:phenylpropionate dioxygenase-like ring-hydroxylating dioxygenase large terminal subunit